MSLDEPRARTVYQLQLQRKLPVTLNGLTAEMRVDELRIERDLRELLWEQDPPESPSRLPHVTAERSILEVSIPCWVGDRGFHPIAQWLAEGAFTGGPPMPCGVVRFAGEDVKVMVRTSAQVMTDLSWPGVWSERLRLQLLMPLTGGDEFAADDAEWEIDVSGMPRTYVVRPKPGLPEVKLDTAVTRRAEA